MTTDFYVLRCRDCDDDIGMEIDIPFPSAEERGRWASLHKHATGHDRWTVFDVHRTNPGTSQVEDLHSRP